jgi:hypothetical protein
MRRGSIAGGLRRDKALPLRQPGPWWGDRLAAVAPWFETRGVAALLTTMRVLTPRPEEHRDNRCVSKDEAPLGKLIHHLRDRLAAGGGVGVAAKIPGA